MIGSVWSVIFIVHHFLVFFNQVFQNGTANLIKNIDLCVVFVYYIYVEI